MVRWCGLIELPLTDSEDRRADSRDFDQSANFCKFRPNGPSTRPRMDEDFLAILNNLPQLVQTQLKSLVELSHPVTANIQTSLALPALPDTGLGTKTTFEHILSDIIPNLAQGHAGPRYYGITLILLYILLKLYLNDFADLR